MQFLYEGLPTGHVSTVIKSGMTCCSVPRISASATSETLPEDQMLLGLEDVEQAAAYSETAQDVSAPERLSNNCRRSVWDAGMS
jgi:hypothetical protein